MNNKKMLSMLKMFGLQGLFIKSEEKFEITDKDISNLNSSILEEIKRNEGRPVAVITFNGYNL